MKKLISLITALVLCVSLSVSAFAAISFVPSITFKDGPGWDWTEFDGDDVSDCLVITTIKQANDKSTDITQEERDLLLDVYKQLSDGTMTLPLDGDYEILHLLDINFRYEDCRQQHDHGDKFEILNETDKSIKVKFTDVGVSAGDELIVMTYSNGKWEKISSAVNNGDGSVTCEFEHFCPVAFAVKKATTPSTPPQTGEGFNAMPLWIGTMALSGVALVTLVIVALKKKKEQ